jgi:hypothetical protein
MSKYAWMVSVQHYLKATASSYTDKIVTLLTCLSHFAFRLWTRPSRCIIYIAGADIS